MLTTKQRSHLRSLAHHLKPVVMTGSAGLTAAVIKEIEQALDHHELIKVKLNSGDRHTRTQLSRSICDQTGAAQVQEIGRITVIYRPAKEAKIKLPN